MEQLSRQSDPLVAVGTVECETCRGRGYIPMRSVPGHPFLVELDPDGDSASGVICSDCLNGKHTQYRRLSEIVAEQVRKELGSLPIPFDAPNAPPSEGEGS